MTSSAASNLPSIDEWMVLRAKLTAVLGDEHATTLLSVLPSPVDGGFASNGRLDLMESRLRADLAATNGRIDASASAVRSELGGEIAATNARIDSGLAATNARIDVMESRLRAEIVQASSDTLKSMRALFFQLVGVMCTLGGFDIAAAKLL